MKIEDMQVLDGIILIVGLIGFFIALIVQFRLKDCVSREKVSDMEDISSLWRNPIPPKEVLNEKGLYLYKLYNVGAGIFIFSVLIMIIRGQ
jgi:hypothetical protein